MKLIGFKNRMIGWLMLYISIGYLPLAYSGDIIYPFLLIPTAGIEKFNYAAGIVTNVRPLILLYVLYAMLSHLSRVNIDSTVNEWISRSIRDIIRMVVALMAFRAKELFDYLTYENVVPACFDTFWFLMLWEFLPVLLVLGWAVLSAKLAAKCLGEM